MLNAIQYICLSWLSLICIYTNVSASESLISSLRISIEIRHGDGADGLDSTVAMTVQNTADKAVLLRNPAPVSDNDTSDERSPDQAPRVVLVISSPEMKKPEEFLLTTSEAREGAGNAAEMLTLQPKEKRLLRFDLSSFRRWGPCGPDVSASFATTVGSGKMKINVKALLIFPPNDERIESAMVEIAGDVPSARNKGARNKGS